MKKITSEKLQNQQKNQHMYTNTQAHAQRKTENLTHSWSYEIKYNLECVVIRIHSIATTIVFLKMITTRIALLPP